MAERCDMTDLLTDQCGHCHPERIPQAPISRAVRVHIPAPGPYFAARFGGECDGCGDRIREGDRIRADGEGGWLCEACGEEAGDA